jgi:hypothetical protein
MTDEGFNRRLNEADRAMHPVAKQWHYPIMVRYGFEPVTKEAQGFVRTYEYRMAGHVIRVTTGYNTDSWTDVTRGKTGLWAELEPHLKTLV